MKTTIKRKFNRLKLSHIAISWRCLVLAYFIISTLKMNAQTLPYQRYSTEDGLCNNDVFDIAKDKNGNFWLATDNGLSKFDGGKFKNFFTENGLADNSLTGVATWGDTVLIATYKNGIQWMINNKVSAKVIDSYRFRNSILLASNAYAVAEWGNRDDNTHFYRMYDRKFRILSLKGELLHSGIHSNKRPIYSFDSNYVYANGKRLFQLPKTSTEKKLHCLEYDTKKQWWLLVDKHILVVNTNMQLQKKIDLRSILSNDSPIDMTVDSEQTCWLKTRNGKGYRILADGTIQSITSLLGLSEKTLLRKFFYDDATHSLWIAMAGKGIYVIDKSYVTNYDIGSVSNANPMILSIGKDKNNTMWFGTDNEIIKFDGTRFEKKEVKGLKYFHQIINFGGKIYILGSRTIEKITKHPTYFFNDASMQIALFPNRVFAHKNSLLANSISLFLPSKSNPTHISFILESFDLTKNEQKNIKERSTNFSSYVATENLKNMAFNGILRSSATEEIAYGNLGFHIFNSKNKKIYVPENTPDFLKTAINRIDIDSQNRLFILGEKGLGIWKNGKWIFQSTKWSDFPLKEIKAKAIDKKGRIWLGTKSGLLLLEKNNVRVFNQKNGLVSSQINDVFYDEQRNIIWIATTEGISKIAVAALENSIKTKPILEIGTIQSLKKEYQENQDIRLANDDNYLKIELNAKNLQEYKSVLYQYRLDNQQDWQTTTPTLTISNLQFGSYHLEIRIKTPNSDFSDIKKIHFYISPPLYKNWLFWIILFAILLFIVYNEIGRQAKRRKEKQATEQQIIELKQQGMASMMNPHFIFNALNSIQYFVNNDELLKANEYMAQFGKLMRQNLEAAYKSTVSLADEIRFIEIYIQLESMRFSEKFSYSIDIDPALPTTSQLPAMFIQPFVENAILHGILPSERLGNLLIRFLKVDDDYLKIEIEDNGIGIHHSIKKSSHTSRSMEIIKKRILLLQEIDVKTSIQLTDLSETQKGFGTKVIMVLKLS
jgi:ligand-binding sensor domain-containing protein